MKENRLCKNRYKIKGKNKLYHRLPISLSNDNNHTSTQLKYATRCTPKTDLEGKQQRRGQCSRTE